MDELGYTSAECRGDSKQHTCRATRCIYLCSSPPFLHLLYNNTDPREWSNLLTFADAHSWNKAISEVTSSPPICAILCAQKFISSLYMPVCLEIILVLQYRGLPIWCSDPAASAAQIASSIYISALCGACSAIMQVPMKLYYRCTETRTVF